MPARDFEFRALAAMSERWDARFRQEQGFGVRITTCGTESRVIATGRTVAIGDDTATRDTARQPGRPTADRGAAR